MGRTVDLDEYVYELRRQRTKTTISSVTCLGDASHVPRSVSVYSPSFDAVSSAAKGKEEKG